MSDTDTNTGHDPEGEEVPAPSEAPVAVQPQGAWVEDPSAPAEPDKMPRSMTLVAHCYLDLIERLYTALPEIGSALFVSHVGRLIDESWMGQTQSLGLDARGVYIAKNFRRPRQKKYRVDLDAVHVAMLRVVLRCTIPEGSAS